MDGSPQTTSGTGAIAVDEVIAARVLRAALADGGEYADLFFEHRRSLQVSLEHGRVSSIGAGVDAGVGIRVMHGGAVGFAHADSFEPALMIAAARTAAQVARARGVLRPARPRDTTDRPTMAREQPGLDAAACVDVLRRVDRAARLADPAIVRVEASLSLSWREIRVVTGTGILAHDLAPLLRISVTALAERGGRREAGTAGGGGRIELAALTAPEHLGREAARIALVNLDARAAPAGTMPVVLAPGDAGIWLHEAVGHGLEADFIHRRSSSYSDRLGQQVARPQVTIVDDPRLPGARGSLAVDDEGITPNDAHLLIDRGVLHGLLHDRRSAHMAGITSPGSGRRQSFRDLPLPRMSNTWMAAGSDDPADIVRSVKRGIYAVGFSGGQVNIAAGDFVFALTEGYLIEDGRITAPLRGVHLIGNGPAALAAVTMVGHDLRMSDGTWTCTKDGQNVPVGVGLPTVKIDALTVGGTAVAGTAR